MPADTAGRDLVVQGSNRVDVHDVLVGDVWLCTGQSNMEFPIDGWSHPLHVRRVVATSSHPDIRLIDVPNLAASAPRKDFRGRWLPASPATIAGFPSVGYFFALRVQRETGVPIGLIEADWGGTAIEPWIPADGYARSPQLAAEYRQLQQWQRRWADEQADYGVPRAAHPLPLPVADNQLPTVLYNAMIAPLAGYGIRGALWYQGEQNVTDQTIGYYHDLKALIDGWRRAWGQGDFPFIIAQIAPFGGYEHPQMEPLIWAAQIRAAQRLKNVGIAGTMDLGDLDDIHFKDKQDVGKRMALWALARVYGRRGLVYSGPVYRSMDVEGAQVVIHFSHTGSGLASRDGAPLDWFQLAGADGRFVDAQARIRGKDVVVRAPAVLHPVAVRFGWSNVAEPNLMNREGLPAMPFRTATVP
jgi:sialate O-acetylesterase